MIIENRRLLWNPILTETVLFFHWNVCKVIASKQFLTNIAVCIVKNRKSVCSSYAFIRTNLCLDHVDSLWSQLSDAVENVHHAFILSHVQHDVHCNETACSPCTSTAQTKVQPQNVLCLLNKCHASLTMGYSVAGPTLMYCSFDLCLKTNLPLDTKLISGCYLSLQGLSHHFLSSWIN